MGVTLYCLIYGRLPFPKSNMVELFEAIKNDPYVKNFKIRRMYA